MTLSHEQAEAIRDARSRRNYVAPRTDGDLVRSLMSLGLVREEFEEDFLDGPLGYPLTSLGETVDITGCSDYQSSVLQLLDHQLAIMTECGAITLDLDQLNALAKAAIEMPRPLTYDTVVEYSDRMCAFNAAANPAVVLALIGRVREMEYTLTQLQKGRE